MAFHIHLNFGPHWDNVSNIRTFVTQMLSTKVLEMSDAKRVAIASSELIENVAKYSEGGEAVVDIKKDVKNGKISIIVQNLANNSNIEKFESIYSLIIDGDPREVYKTMMLRSFNSPENSQLGLARIRYECQGEIFYQIDNDNVANIDLSEIDINNNDFQLLSVEVKIPVTLLER
ncbi:MAG: hypothetical protein GY699_10370 [Desulfobacteraceae bacterium]|nr:hypothetical protein [Desulfobacteraceae bacterium]